MRSLSTASLALLAGLPFLACGDSDTTGPGDGAVASVVVTPSELALAALGDTATLSATARDADGRTVPGATFTWSSLDEDVATVSASGRVTAAGNGTATVRASTAGVSGSASVEVAQAAARLAFQLQPGTAEGQEPFQVVVAVEDANGHLVPGATGLVDLALDANPSGATLAGSAAVAADEGLATFDDLSIALPGTGFTLQATSGSLTAATSEPFDVRLTFTAMDARNGRRTCGLTSADHAYCWGRNAFGQLGDGTTTDRPSPVPVVGGHAFAALSTGAYHACALTAQGAAYCWGLNTRGQLGDGGTADSPTPVAVAGEHAFRTIHAGYQFTCALDDTGAAYCWGANGRGELGDGSMTDSPVPVPVAGGLTFQQISAGIGYTCGITDTQKAYCWGYGGGNGQLGNGQGGSEATPDSVWYDGVLGSIRTGWGHTCALTPDGEALCWGANTNGQLGTGSTSGAVTPELVATTLRFADVSPGGNHTCAVTASGAAYCWGLNDNGQLGTGGLASDSVPVAVTGGLLFATITAGFDHSCGLADGGGPFCWGRNLAGQLGDGSGSDSTEPVAVEH